ncbi:hypothetical protein PVAP13_3KG388200 [Panicum virgatum]|uniref:Uncharacterized protein n=1 Tax=Panicum virgatum TaxID=38727 RepID=A0A8T0V943_PANVG|nr:hypothetical protein PVAP13_3KG388200 [Panicum virgatum]
MWNDAYATRQYERTPQPHLPSSHIHDTTHSPLSPYRTGDAMSACAPPASATQLCPPSPCMHWPKWWRGWKANPESPTRKPSHGRFHRSWSARGAELIHVASGDNNLSTGSVQALTSAREGIDLPR